MSKYALPQEVVNEVKDGMKDSSGVKLPFPAPVMWWMNGKPALKEETEILDATRFGGWGISKEDIDALNVAPAPSWKLKKMASGQGGGTYEAYICRTAWVAPIARRFAWFENEGKSKSSVNVLAYLYLRNEKGEFTEYGAVVLSAKSNSGLELDAAFKKFTALTAKLREDTPSQFFFHGIGTFGDTPIFKEVGKGSNVNSITPPQLAIPKDGFTSLDKYFVGAEVAAKMAQLKRDSAEWIADWEKRGKKNEAAPSSAMQEVAYVPPSEDIPY